MRIRTSVNKKMQFVPKTEQIAVVANQSQLATLPVCPYQSSRCAKICTEPFLNLSDLGNRQIWQGRGQNESSKIVR